MISMASKMVQSSYAVVEAHAIKSVRKSVRARWPREAAATTRSRRVEPLWNPEANARG